MMGRNWWRISSTPIHRKRRDEGGALRRGNLHSLLLVLFPVSAQCLRRLADKLIRWRDGRLAGPAIMVAGRGRPVLHFSCGTEVTIARGQSPTHCGKLFIKIKGKRRRGEPMGRLGLLALIGSLMLNIMFGPVAVAQNAPSRQ